jgi:hypothetical protein
MNNKDENLKELLNRFYTEPESAKIEKDILRGEQIIADNPAPQPDARLISDIKARVKGELARRENQRVFTYLRATVTAAAAVLIIGVTLLMIHRVEQPSRPNVVQGTIPSGIWESEDLMNDDVGLAVLAANIDAVEDDVLAMRFNDESYEMMNLDDVEADVLEISDDLWKG